MRVLVLGAGVVGTASAWYLAQAGHQVTVVDRQPVPGNETSFANGGQISVSHAEPGAIRMPCRVSANGWAREEAPLLCAGGPTGQLAWGLRFLGECLPGRTRHNMAAIVALALYSRRQLQQLRAELGCSTTSSKRGILHIYTDRQEHAMAVEATAAMRQFGLDRESIDVDRCLDIEPALADARHLLVGGDYTISDESGDAHKFTRALAERAQAAGVEFRLNLEVERIAPGGSQIAGILAHGEGGGELLTADAYVVALGSYSPLLLKPLGIGLPVYPAKGYSATLKLLNGAPAPSVSLTDDERKLVSRVSAMSAHRRYCRIQRLQPRTQ